MADKALLTGINNYRHISNLRGCENDVHNMERLLREQFGFASANVQTLLSRNVTKERVLKGWDWLLRDAKPGDRLVFHFSGHGSYTTDLDDDEPDGADELICLHDMDWDDDQTYFLDDELRAFTQRVPPGVRLTIILDNCHSGTGTRMAMAPAGTRGLGLAPEKMPVVDVRASLARLESTSGTRSASLSGDQAGDTVERLLAPSSAADERNTVLARFVEPPAKVLAAIGRRGVRSGFREVRTRGASDMNHVLWAGSEATQTSADAHIGGSFNGAFTYYFCEAVRSHGANVQHQDLIEELRRTLRRERFSQVPQLEPEDAAGPLFNRREANHSDSPSGPGPITGIGGSQQSNLELIEQLIAELEKLRAQLAAKRNLNRGPGGDRGLGDALGKLQQSLGGFADNLGKKLATLLDDAATLEISTFACDQLEAGAVTDPQLRAKTKVKPDGDTDVFIPQAAGQVDERVWEIHGDTVKQAQEHRAKMIASMISAVTSLMKVLPGS